MASTSLTLSLGQILIPEWRKTERLERRGASSKPEPSSCAELPGPRSSGQDGTAVLRVVSERAAHRKWGQCKDKQLPHHLRQAGCWWWRRRRRGEPPQQRIKIGAIVSITQQPNGAVTLVCFPSTEGGVAVAAKLLIGCIFLPSDAFKQPLKRQRLPQP